jgi:TRAP-type C4-dicarboxylate transport system permease small subunit
MAAEREETREARRASLQLLAVADAISRIGGWLSSLLIVVVLTVTAVSVFSRYVLGRPLIGGDEATGFLVVAIVMLGAAEALRRGDHIRIDLLHDRASARVRWWLEVLAHAAVVAFSILLFLTAWHTVVFSRQFGAYSTGYLALPMWMLQSTMLVGAVLLALAALAGLLRHFGEGR